MIDSFPVLEHLEGLFGQGRRQEEEEKEEERQEEGKERRGLGGL